MERITEDIRVRHPRTAVALTEQNKLLLVTVDGRADLAAGMTAKELTSFINQYFKPQHALNVDGEGLQRCIYATVIFQPQM